MGGWRPPTLHCKRTPGAPKKHANPSRQRLNTRFLTPKLRWNLKLLNPTTEVPKPKTLHQADTPSEVLQNALDRAGNSAFSPVRRAGKAGRGVGECSVLDSGTVHAFAFLLATKFMGFGRLLFMRWGFVGQVRV